MPQPLFCRLAVTSASACLLAAATASVHAQEIAFGDFYNISDANWSAGFSTDFPLFEEGFSDEVGPLESTGFFEWNQWAGDFGGGYGDTFEQMFSQTYFLRTSAGLNDRNYNVGELSLVSVPDDPFGDFSDTASFSYVGGGLAIDLTYQLDGGVEGNPLDANVRAGATLRNTSGAALDLTWIAYTDLDLDQDVDLGASANNDLSRLFSASTIRQSSQLGSVVDLRSVGDLNPTAFTNTTFPSLIDLLEEGQITGLDNNPMSGPGDVENALEWSFTLDAGASVDLALLYEGSFIGGSEDVVFPDNVVDNGDGTFTFVFDDGSPPVIGEAPRTYDPDAAVGYAYEITEGDNGFGELFLPDFFATDGLVLEILDPDHSRFGELILLTPEDDTLFFSFVDVDNLDGAAAFRVTGIDPSLDLDPNDPLAFPTGLTFVSTDAVSFEQTALVPEPASAAVLLMGLGGVLRRRRAARA